MRSHAFDEFCSRLRFLFRGLGLFRGHGLRRFCVRLFAGLLYGSCFFLVEVHDRRLYHLALLGLRAAGRGKVRVNFQLGHCGGVCDNLVEEIAGHCSVALSRGLESRCNGRRVRGRGGFTDNLLDRRRGRSSLFRFNSSHGFFRGSNRCIGVSLGGQGCCDASFYRTAKPNVALLLNGQTFVISANYFLGPRFLVLVEFLERCFQVGLLGLQRSILTGVNCFAVRLSCRDTGTLSVNGGGDFTRRCQRGRRAAHRTSKSKSKSLIFPAVLQLLRDRIKTGGHTAGEEARRACFPQTADDIGQRESTCLGAGAALSLIRSDGSLPVGLGSHCQRVGDNVGEFGVNFFRAFCETLPQEVLEEAVTGFSAQEFFDRPLFKEHFRGTGHQADADDLVAGRTFFIIVLRGCRRRAHAHQRTIGRRTEQHAAKQRVETGHTGLIGIAERNAENGIAEVVRNLARVLTLPQLSQFVASKRIARRKVVDDFARCGTGCLRESLRQMQSGVGVDVSARSAVNDILCECSHAAEDVLRNRREVIAQSRPALRLVDAVHLSVGLTLIKKRSERIEIRISGGFALGVVQIIVGRDLIFLELAPALGIALDHKVCPNILLETIENNLLRLFQLIRVEPHVAVFIPSIEEHAELIRNDRGGRFLVAHDITGDVDEVAVLIIRAACGKDVTDLFIAEALCLTVGVEFFLVGVNEVAPRRYLAKVRVVLECIVRVVYGISDLVLAIRLLELPLEVLEIADTSVEQRNIGAGILTCHNTTLCHFLAAGVHQRSNRRVKAFDFREVVFVGDLAEQDSSVIAAKGRVPVQFVLQCFHRLNVAVLLGLKEFLIPINQQVRTVIEVESLPLGLPSRLADLKQTLGVKSLASLLEFFLFFLQLVLIAKRLNVAKGEVLADAIPAASQRRGSCGLGGLDCAVLLCDFLVELRDRTLETDVRCLLRDSVADTGVVSVGVFRRAVRVEEIRRDRLQLVAPRVDVGHKTGERCAKFIAEIVVDVHSVEGVEELLRVTLDLREGVLGFRFFFRGFRLLGFLGLSGDT